MDFALKRRRRCRFLLINPPGLTSVVEGRLLLWIHEGIKESPLFLFSPDDDRTGDKSQRGERVMRKRSISLLFFCLTFFFFCFVSSPLNPSFTSFILNRCLLRSLPSLCPLRLVFPPSPASHIITFMQWAINN